MSGFIEGVIVPANPVGAGTAVIKEDLQVVRDAIEPSAGMGVARRWHTIQDIVATTHERRHSQ